MSPENVRHADRSNRLWFWTGTVSGYNRSLYRSFNRPGIFNKLFIRPIKTDKIARAFFILKNPPFISDIFSSIFLYGANHAFSSIKYSRKCSYPVFQLFGVTPSTAAPATRSCINTTPSGRLTYSSAPLQSGLGIINNYKEITVFSRNQKSKIIPKKISKISKKLTKNLKTS